MDRLHLYIQTHKNGQLPISSYRGCVGTDHVITNTHSNYHLSEMELFQEAFSGKRFVCCTLTIQYIIVYCSTVGWSIAAI